MSERNEADWTSRLEQKMLRIAIIIEAWRIGERKEKTALREIRAELEDISKTLVDEVEPK